MNRCTSFHSLYLEIVAREKALGLQEKRLKELELRLMGMVNAERKSPAVKGLGDSGIQTSKIPITPAPQPQKSETKIKPNTESPPVIIDNQSYLTSYLNGKSSIVSMEKVKGIVLKKILSLEALQQLNVSTHPKFTGRASILDRKACWYTGNQGNG